MLKAFNSNIKIISRKLIHYLPLNSIYNLKTKSYSSIDYMKIENIRSKLIGNLNTNFSAKERSKIRNHENQMEKFLHEKEEIILASIPEILNIFKMIIKRKFYKAQHFIPLCLRIFKVLKGNNFPVIIVPYFLNFLIRTPNPKDIIEQLPKSFIGDFTTSFYQQAVILSMDELLNISLIPKLFEIDDKFIPFLENNILHKLEYIEKNTDFNNILLVSTENFINTCTENTLEKFLKKTSDLINDNLIEFNVLSNLLYSIRHSQQVESRRLIVDYFLFNIRDYLFEIPKDQVKFNMNLLMLLVYRKYKFDITKNGVNLGNVLIQSFLHKVNLLTPPLIYNVIRTSAMFIKDLELDNNTINKIGMIALSNISKADKSHQLQKLIYFFTRTMQC